jgi:hypothetical protein
LGFLADICADGDDTVLCVRPEWEGAGDISVLDGLLWYVRGNDSVLDSNIERVRLEEQGRKIMNRAQKISLTMVITFLLGLFLGVILIVMRLFDLGVPKIAFLFPVFIAGSGGIISITCFKKDKGTVIFDERDKLIEKNANLAGFGAVYLYVIVMSFLPIGILGENGSIPVTWCPALLIGAGFCQTFAQSIAILIQYGLVTKGEKS